MDTSTLSTNFVVSLSDPGAYAMLATLADPVKVTLPTNTTTRGQIRQQIATVNLITHTKIILGRTYLQLLTDPDINANIPPLHYSQTKGLACSPSDKMAWATNLLEHTNVLRAYE
jgi:hypothetical protein